MNIELEAAELAVLLTMLDATSVPGFALEHLFPENPEARQVILDQGLSALQRHGYMDIQGRQIEKMHNQLLLAIAVIAAPAQIVAVTHHLDEGEQYFAYHIADDLIVEIYLTASERYRLVALGSMETVAARIAHRAQQGAAIAMQADRTHHVEIEISQYANGVPAVIQSYELHDAAGKQVLIAPPSEHAADGRQLTTTLQDVLRRLVVKQVA